MNLELFACSGGMAEGFRRAGIHFDLVIDKNPDAAASYTANLGHAPVLIDVRDFLRLVRGGWGPSEPIDLLVADPPCTPWSNAGKREGLADERDCLRETIEIIAWLRPRTYLIGNVPGLETEPNRKAVHETIGSLARHGYCVADAAILDAADYGVPQRRIRPFWFGHLDGPCLRWPSPTHAEPSATLALEGLALKPWVTCREALAHLTLEELGRPVALRRRTPGQGHPASRADEPGLTQTTRASGGSSILEWSEDVCDAPNGLDRPAKTLTACAHNGSKIIAGAGLLENAKHPISRPDMPSRTVTTKGDGRGAQGACVLAWPWERPATTVTADERLPPPGHHPDSGSILTVPNAVKITERAAAILQGFPEGWVFAGKTKTARWSQIGQAMPPPLAHAVAAAIARRSANLCAEAAE